MKKKLVASLMLTAVVAVGAISTQGAAIAAVGNWPDSVHALAVGNWPDGGVLSAVGNWPDSVGNWPDGGTLSAVGNWPDSVRVLN